MAKNGFDWEQFPDAQQPAKVGSSKFSWDDFPDAVPESKEPKTSAAQTALESFGNAASVGYLPQLQAAASKLMPDPTADVKAKLEAQGFTIEDKDTSYIAQRDANIKRMQMQSAEHPYASAAGTVGGAIASGVAASALAPINAAARLGRMAQAAKGGAILGVAANPGDKEGEISPLQLKDRAANAVIGATLSGAGQGAIESLAGAAKAVTNLPKSLQAKAEERAFKASGAMLRDYRKAYGQDRINEIGRFMLDNGMIKPGMSVADIAEAATKLKEVKGKGIEKVLEKLGALEEEIGGKATRTELAQAVKAQLVQDGNIPTAAANNKYFSNLASKLEKMKGKELSIDDLQKIKNSANKQINWDRLPGADIPLEEQFNRAIYTQAKQLLESRAEDLAKKAGNQTYKGLKDAYRNSADVERIANDQALRQNANRFFSPSDYVTGATGAIAGAMTGDDLESKLKNAAIGAGIGLVNKGVRTYGTPLVSQALDKAGRLLSKTPLQEAGKVVNPVMAAAERSPVSAAATSGKLGVPAFDRAGPAAMPAAADYKEQRGEQRWIANGARRLGIEDQDLMARLMSTKEGRGLLIQASDLAPGSKGLERIKETIKKGWGSNYVTESVTAPASEVSGQQRKPSSRR